MSHTRPQLVYMQEDLGSGQALQTRRAQDRGNISDFLTHTSMTLDVTVIHIVNFNLTIPSTRLRLGICEEEVSFKNHASIVMHSSAGTILLGLAVLSSATTIPPIDNINSSTTLSQP